MPLEEYFIHQKQCILWLFIKAPKRIVFSVKQKAYRLYLGPNSALPQDKPMEIIREAFQMIAEKGGTFKIFLET